MLRIGLALGFFLTVTAGAEPPDRRGNNVHNDGNTWMRVRSRQGVDLNCDVRAHRDLIAPASP